MKKLISLIIFLIAVNCFSQQTIDSLKTLLKNQEIGSENYINTLNELGYDYWIIDSNESIKYGIEALKLSDSLGYLFGKAKANRVLGVAYWTRGNHVNAINYLDQALKQNTELNNLEGIANTTLNLAMVYAALKDNDKALKMYEDAINQFTLLNLKSRIATTFTKIGSLYIDENKLEEAKEYLTNALKMHTDANFDYGISEAHNRLGLLYINLNEKELAYYHIEKSIITGRKVNDRDGILNNLLQYGKLLVLDKEFTNAEDHFKQAIRQAKESNLKRYELEAYNELKNLKRLEGKSDEALMFYDQYIILKDSIYNSDKSMQIAAIEFKNEIQTKEKELELLKEKEKANSVIKWSLIFGLTTLIVIAIMFLLNLKKHNKQQRELLLAKEEFNKTELENSKLKQQELKQQLDYRNKELTSYTLNFVQKNELFHELNEKVSLLKTATAKEQGKIINDLNRIIKKNINIDKDWEDFKRFFEDVHVDFTRKLKVKHPELSSNDLKICALARLNLSIKESAVVLGITPESVKTARYRLRKKLNLDQNEELLGYFLSLGQKE